MKMTRAAERWSDALATWAIPDRILSAAPVSPWVHPPKMFQTTANDPTNTPSMRAAAEMLGAGGTVLDVGCGGGRSSLPLGGLLRHVTGADEQQEMLTQFTSAAARRGIANSTVLGKWPAAAIACPIVDVVVCHHVVYNVSEIDTFVAALDSHATFGVVVELPNRHPQSPLNELWDHFWKLARPLEPSAELFAEVVAETGRTPKVETAKRPQRRPPVDRAELVAFVRQRLCLTPDRDAEINDLLGPKPELNSDTVVTVSWRTG
jgi:SAM-dependent methyltransferase